VAYSELIKSFGRIRAYMRAFYVYGFQRRDEYGQKSARSYDDERRRLESWLGDCMGFRQDASGRRFFLSVDSRAIDRNPLYRAFRAKSFTDRDIMLHFHLMDILAASVDMPIFDIMEALSERLNTFALAEYPDESTVRRKLAELEKLGLVRKERKGREARYSRTADGVNLESWREAVDFFSEAAPLGVIGDFCRDKLEPMPSLFRFKHHYILNALDGEVMLALIGAIAGGREATLAMGRRRVTVAPLKLYVSVQTGRQYVLVWSPWNRDFGFFRLDAIDTVKPGDAAQLPPDADVRLRAFMGRVWGVSRARSEATTHLEMTVFVDDGEGHIPRRLEREKRCGRVERLDGHHWRFTADVYDALEMLPWLRTFTGRITALKCDDPRVTERFYGDLAAVAALYGGDGDAVP
jgi:DNA-binding transcriptional ArsR family regulator